MIGDLFEKICPLFNLSPETKFEKQVSTCFRFKISNKFEIPERKSMGALASRVSFS